MRDIPRYFREQIAEMRAGEARGFTPPRVTLEGRDGSITAVTNAQARGHAALHAVQADAGDHSARRTGGAARRGREGHPRTGAAGLCGAAEILGRRICAPCAHHAGGRGVARRQGLLPPADPRIHHARSCARSDPRDRARRSRQAPRRDAGGDARDRLQGRFSGLPELSAQRSAVLCQDAAGVARTTRRGSPRSSTARPRNYFGLLPRARFAIVPVPADLAPFYTAGRGGPGVYLLNTYDLPLARSTT